MMNGPLAFFLEDALDRAHRIRVWANAANRQWPITTSLLLLCGCAPTQVEPFSSCSQPYLEEKLDRSSMEMLRDTRERVEPICSTLPYGCSMSAPLKTKTGYTVAVIPVADISDGQCSYASDSQTYYKYDENRKFIDARGRFIRINRVTP